MLEKPPTRIRLPSEASAGIDPGSPVRIAASASRTSPMLDGRWSGSRATMRRTSRSICGSRGSRSVIGERRNLAAQHGFEQLRGVAALERRRATDKLVEHHAERKDVGATVHLAARRLFRRRIGKCADEPCEALGEVRRSSLVTRVRPSQWRDASRHRSRAPSRARCQSPSRSKA